MSEHFLENQIPYAEQAEAAIIAVMFKDKDAIHEAVQLINESDFYKPENAIFFRAIVELDENKQNVDIISVADKLEKENLLEKVGGYVAIGRIADAHGSIYNLEQYVKIVREKAVLRELIKISERVRSRSLENSEPVESILDDAERWMLDISKQRQRNELVKIYHVVSDTLRDLDEKSKMEGEVTGIPSGFIDLDRMTGGWQRSDLVILAARPAMGKTAFCLNIAANAAVDHGISVAVFSLEMSKEQLVNRMLSSAARIDQRRLSTGQINPEDWGPFLQKITPLSEAPIYIDDTPAITVRELRAKARRLQAKEDNLGLIVLDYLQLMGGSGHSENRQQEVSEISRSLKALARELKVPIIALSQLSRTVEQTKDKIPQLSHLRESGSLEQDADIVLFIHREEYYDPNTERQGIADIIIAKHRNGPTGRVELAFQSELTKFENLAHEYDI